MSKDIYVLGVGHNTPVFIDLALACGYNVLGLYHYSEDRTDEIDHGFRIIGSFEELFNQDSLEGKNFLLSMGDISRRKELYNRIVSKGGKLPTLIHPYAVISQFASVSDSGVLISPFTYVQADSCIGENTILLSHVNISHSTVIGRNCFIAGGATIGAYTVVEDEVFVGQGALSISNKVKLIGTGAYIGARALLTRDVPSNAVMSGSPARIIN